MRRGFGSNINTIYIVTQDAELVGACREALSGWEGELIANSESDRGDADLWVWDCRSQQQPAQRPEDLSRCIFLAERNGLLSFPEDVLLFAAAVVLLPVDAIRLSIAFEQAFARRHSHHAAQHRDDKDALLQCFLQANLKLQQYDQDRTNFFNRALHDFRAPLTSITGYCGLLLSGHAGALEPHVAEPIRRIQNSAKRLSRQVDGMFRLGLRRVKQIKPELVRGDVYSVVERATEEVDVFAQPKQITVSMELNEPHGELLFEPEKITQLLINLLENACRFSPKKGVIQIKGYSDFWERRATKRHERFGFSDRRSRRDLRPNAYRIDVVDFGLGIPPEHLESIFEEYTSYSGGKDRSGTGLGLAISKEIVEGHNGRIWAESRLTGATFSFVLPYKQSNSEVQELALAAATA